MRPGQTSSLSSISPTISGVWSWSSGASRLSWSLLRCCTMTTGIGKSAGSALAMVLSALSPPHDAPMTITPRTAPRSSSGISPHLAVDLVRHAERLEAVLVLGELERLLAPQPEDPERRQALVEQPVHPLLERAVEVDQDVAAEDDVALGERAVRHQVVLREDDVLEQRRPEEGAVVLRDVVLRERALPAGADVVLGVLLHPLDREDAGLRLLEHHLVDVGGVDPRPLVQPLLLEEDGHREDLLAGGTAGVPHADEGVGAEQRDHGLPEREVEGRVPVH